MKTITKTQLNKLIQEAIKEQMSSDSSEMVDPTMLRNAASRANSLGDDLKQMTNFIHNINKFEDDKDKVTNSLAHTIKNLNRVANMLEEIHDKVQGQSFTEQRDSNHEYDAYDEEEEKAEIERVGLARYEKNLDDLDRDLMRNRKK